MTDLKEKMKEAGIAVEENNLKEKSEPKPPQGDKNKVPVEAEITHAILRDIDLRSGLGASFRLLDSITKKDMIDSWQQKIRDILKRKTK